MDFRRKVGEDDLTIQSYYALFKVNALAYALDACLRMEDAKNRGIALSEPLIDLEREAPLMEEFCQELEQMENCALLHDIGKYFCLDIVNNSSWSLTDDEFAIVKEHPTNFAKIYPGGGALESSISIGTTPKKRVLP